MAYLSIPKPIPEGYQSLFTYRPTSRSKDNTIIDHTIRAIGFWQEDLRPPVLHESDTQLEEELWEYICSLAITKPVYRWSRVKCPISTCIPIHKETDILLWAGYM